MKKRKLWTLVMAAVLTLTACGNSSDTTGSSISDATSSESTIAVDEGTAVNANGEVEFKWAVTSNATESLDPAWAYNTQNNAVVDQICESLLYYDLNDEIQPLLAESWSVTEDGMTYTYQIRQGVTFSDGTEMTADDVVYSLNRIMNPNIASKLAFMFENVESIEKTGDWEVTVQMKQPDVLFQYAPATTAGMVLNEKWCKQVGEDKIGTNEAGLMGTGPYVLESWTPGGDVVMVKNENYWNEENFTGDVDRITVQYIGDASSLSLAFKANQTDFCLGVPVAIVNELQGYDNVNMLLHDGLNTAYLVFNCLKDQLQDVNVRRAITCAIDWDYIYENVYSSLGEKCSDVVFGPGGGAYIGSAFDKYTPENRKYTYDVDKAKEYLAASAYPNGFSTTITYLSSDPNNETCCLFVQQCLAQIGITVELIPMTYAELNPIRYGYSRLDDGTKDYALMWSGWLADFSDPAGHMIPYYHSDSMAQGGANFSDYSNAEVDALLDKQNAMASNPEKRAELICEAIDIATDECALYPIYYPSSRTCINNKWDYTPTANWFYNVYVKDIKLK